MADPKTLKITENGFNYTFTLNGNLVSEAEQIDNQAMWKSTETMFPQTTFSILEQYVIHSLDAAKGKVIFPTKISHNGMLMIKIMYKRSDGLESWNLISLEPFTKIPEDIDVPDGYHAVAYKEDTIAAKF